MFKLLLLLLIGVAFLGFLGSALFLNLFRGLFSGAGNNGSSSQSAMKWLFVLAVGFLVYQFTGSLIFAAVAGFLCLGFLQKSSDSFSANQTAKSSVFEGEFSAQELFRLTTFATMGHLAKSKGRVTEEDILSARNTMQQMRLSGEAQRQAQEAFNLGKDEHFPLHTMVSEFRANCRDARLINFFIETQFNHAVLDGNLDSNEREVLLVIADALGLTTAQFNQILNRVIAAQQFRQQFEEAFRQQSYSHSSHSGSQQQGSRGGYQQSSRAPSLKDACNTLGVAENADQTTVKRAYRKLMNEHHPDKLAAKGLPPEMMEMAKEKTQEIQAAYDLICKINGWK